MNDTTLQRVWNAREAISRRCAFDAHQLVRFYQTRQKTHSQSKQASCKHQVREDGNNSYGETSVPPDAIKTNSM